MNVSAPRLGLAGVALAALAYAAGYLSAPEAPPAPTLPAVAGMVWPPPPPLEPFELVDADRQPLGPERLRGKWTLLFFGYTHCPDICPTTLAVLKAVRERLRGFAPFDERGQVLFVSVDGERDTPAVLSEYTAYFDPEFVAASGDERSLRQLTRQFGARIIKSSGADPNEYYFDHPASVLMIGPETWVSAEFTPPLDARDIAAQVRAIVGYFEQTRPAG
ncbi:MAG: SCO family protein [Gammaproteobacteria bacterium]